MPHIVTQSEWEADMSVQILEAARAEIYLDLRFLDIALSALKPTEKDGLEAMATDGTALFFSSAQVIRVFKTNPAYLNRAYLHTVLHCIFSHLWIGEHREQTLWNIACDIAVEYTIDKMQKPCTKRALSWLRQQTYQELDKKEEHCSAAVIYRRLMGLTKERQLALQREFYTDDHCFWPVRKEERAGSEAVRNRWSRIARQTAQHEKQRGNEPKEGEERLTAQLTAARSRRSYREFLQKFAVLREEVHIDPDEFDLNYYTYGLQLYKNMPLIEPLESREVMKIREFVIVVDTSYSTSGTLIKHFLQETFTILTQENSFFRDCRIRIIQCDDKVEMDEEVSSQEELEYLLRHFQVVGGGSTDFRPAFAYVNDLVAQGEIKNLGGLLYFTDGKGIYPGKRPDYKSAFLFLCDYDETAVPPWAMRIRLEPEEFEEGRE